MRFTRLAPLAPLALIAACVPRATTPPPEAPAPVTPTPAPRPTPPPTYSNWMDAPQSPGDWTYAGGTATFGRPGEPRLTMTCNTAARTVEIAYLSTQAELVTIRTETTARTFRAAAVPRGSGVARSVLQIAAGDPFLDAIAFSKGRFAIEADGQALYAPAWPKSAG